MSTAKIAADEEIRRLSKTNNKIVRNEKFEAASSRVTECTFEGYMSNTVDADNEEIRSLSEF
ncbi:hypothetical protein [Alkalihalobacillus sp. BA299]|uniref:hypothetical protein n=1 Tax=Alkalihalobacillus sp. BA299 TaxID=2815938 RepID=UPI001ADBEC5C|nr:hypothetical protein [Alkalihalobacillus sp. BA299]